MLWPRDFCIEQYYTGHNYRTFIGTYCSLKLAAKMSSKYKIFGSLSMRQKRRRLFSIQHHVEDSQVQELDGSLSDEILENDEPLRIQPLHPALFVDGDNVQNNEQKTGEKEQRFNRDEEVESNEEEVGNISENNDEIEGGNVDEYYMDEENNTSSSSENEDNHIPENRHDLRKRALKNAFLAANIKHTQGNILLKILREHPFNLGFLPKNVRTLLQTPTAPAIAHVQRIPGGEYLHIGLKYILKKKLENFTAEMLPESVEIDFSTDGAQLSNSGTFQFWPIQFRVVNCTDKRPMIAGVFKGQQKPLNPFDFFEKFIEEILTIRAEGGIIIRNRRLPLHIRCFIADAPARAMVLNYYGHMSANACSKCKVEGYRCEEVGYRGIMVFPGIRHSLRTNEEYNNMVDEDHHKGPSPLNSILGLVTQVPFEPLHLIYLGNVKKVLHTHIQGKYGHQKLNRRQLDILDSRMMQLKLHCPTEFNRRPNKLSMFHHFKATEFRQFLLYTSPVIMENVFHEEYYNHFMLLHCVIRILSCDNVTDDMYTFCQEGLETYVNMCEHLYGKQYVSYNVHGLLHIAGDVRKLGSLESFSAFTYENNMPQFRKYIRKPHLTLQQFYKRMQERNDCIVTQDDNTIKIRPSKSHAEGPVAENIPPYRCQQFKKLQIGKITFSTNERNNCCFLTNSEVCIISNIVQIENNILFMVQKFGTRAHFYNIGITSHVVGVYHCSNLSNTVEAINLIDVKAKMYRMPKWSGVEGQEENIIENEWICVSLLTPLIIPQQ
ncbi:uncharacterized protein LOC116853586 isoform X1 [Odontomachus brunneus]|uniref:uncharacterized protein LOC116853586 isoform X1 n=1 Tax=Odontomachus brunneus TaxID=486640 RepID=UPI0013F2793C|nr:uncharacterized protein LOC116853586 isoform X1 [Odontomachus brunneus]